MSSQRECIIMEVDQKWYYMIEHIHHEESNDWREHAACFGPFTDQEQAEDHLDDNQTNPGGYWTSEGHTLTELDSVDQNLIKNATTRRRRGW